MNGLRINIQSLDDISYFDWLVSLMMTNKNFSSNLSKSKLLEPLKIWITQKTSDVFPVDKKTALGNRIFYLMNDIHDLPHCKTCGKQLDVQFTCYSSLHDYENCFCSSTCSVSDPDVRKRMQCTSLKNNGYISSFSDPNVRKKIQQTIKDKYGVEHLMQCKDIADKVATTNLKLYGSISPFGNKEIQEKICDKCKAKYGVDNPLKSYVIQEQIKHTCQDRYGVDSPFESKEIQQKAQQTLLDKYGSTSYLGTEDCIQKTREWSLETYGVDHHLKSPEIRQQIEQTNLQRYGNKAGKAFGTQYFRDAMLDNYDVEYSMQSKEILDKARHRYVFDGMSFDSAPELAFYIWLKDNNIPFEYQPDASFSYMFDGKEHKYFPDFKVGDIHFEIKGDHFFKEDSTMQNPFDHTQDELYESKHQCMLKNNVVIMTSKEYAIFEHYIGSIYGDKFLMQFKSCK